MQEENETDEEDNMTQESSVSVSPLPLCENAQDLLCKMMDAAKAISYSEIGEDVI